MWKVKAMPDMCASPVRKTRARPYRSYSSTALAEAFCWVMNKNGSVLGAAKKFNVPETTLRDRVNGKVGSEVTSSGPPPLFSLEEENNLVNHLNKMGLLGFGYSRAEILDIATAYAVNTNKRDEDHPLSLKWYRNFSAGWPELNVRKPRNISRYRAKATSEKVVNAYYTELDTIMTKYKLKNAPERIFIVDEKSLQQNHSPPVIVRSSSSSTPVAVTSDKEKTGTIIGAGNALGQQLPPYLVFPGQRMRQELLNGCSPGAAGTVSDTGRSNTSIFKKYVLTHFLKYVTINRSEDEPLLLLYDGHLSRTNLSLIDWAQEQNILLFVLPAHTSRILQPLDLECFGPFESIYDSLCHQHMQANSTTGIDRYSVCEIACNVYTKALSPDNLRSLFKKWGIYPLNSAVVDHTCTTCLPAREDDSTVEVEVDPQGDHSYASLPDLRPYLCKSGENSKGQRKKRMRTSPIMQSKTMSSQTSYSPSAAKRVFHLVRNEDGSVGIAERGVCVPKSTPREPVTGRVDPEVTRSGPAPVSRVPAREDDSAEEVEVDPQANHSYAGLPDPRPDLCKERGDSKGQRKEKKKKMCTSPVIRSRKSSYRSYSTKTLAKALSWVRNTNGSVLGAARRFGVPETTLRERVQGKVGPEVTRSGSPPLFSREEENNLVNHLNKFTLLGFGYSRAEVLDIATAYAVGVNKREKDHPFTLKWFRNFKSRWPELNVKKPQSLNLYRAKATSESVVNAYFAELDQILTKCKLKDAPECIFIVDKKGLKQNHSPPVIVRSSSSSTPVAVTSDKEKTVTIIGAGNALGQQLPPYFVFPGQRMRKELLNGCSPGAAGTVSDSGQSNTSIFKKYISTHFLKYTERSEGKPLLLLYDGHLSRTNLSLIDWAQEQNILLFVLPAHTSRIFQPLDLECFGPFESIYNSLCHRQMQADLTTGIDRYSICEIACSAYTKALSPDNLRSSFRKFGIYPLNSAVVDDASYAPAKAVNKCVPAREEDFAEEEFEVDPQGDKSSAGLPDLRPDLFKERGDSKGQRKKNMCISPILQARASSYRSYSSTALAEAFCWVRNKNGSVLGAAKKFNVPETTLRDRVQGKVGLEVTSSGPPPLFSRDEENNLVNHLKKMARLGFGYSRAEVLDIATAYAVGVNKREKDHPLTLKWFRSFKLRWPEMNVRRARNISRYRAKATSEMVVNAYFAELDQIMTKYKLKNAPERIFTVDEKSLQQNHSPPVIVRSSSSSTPVAVTSDKDAPNVTIIGAGNALGQQLPPYFVFPGQGMRQELLNGCSPGAAGTVSDTGRSNTSIFKTYISTHFLKYVTLSRSEDEPLLLLYDGHLSRTNLSLIDWAQEQNILLFVLPAHTSRILQREPLDLECFGPFESIYDSLFHQQMLANLSTGIDKYPICEIACNAYTKALSPDILRSLFKKWGIYPLNNIEVNDAMHAPDKAISECVPEREDDSTVEVEVDPQGDCSSAGLPDLRPDLCKEREDSNGQRKKKMCTSPVIQTKMSSYRSYSTKTLTKALSWVRNKNGSVLGAARKFGVPETTLRDRVNGKVAPEVTRSGPPPLFSQEEENNLVNHLKKMARLGFGYARSEVINLATIYAVSVNKRDEEHPLSTRWYSNFMLRWPELNVKKPQSQRKEDLAEEAEGDPQSDHSSACLSDSRPDFFKDIEDSTVQRKKVAKKRRCPSTEKATRKKIAKYNARMQTSIKKQLKTKTKRHKKSK